MDLNKSISLSLILKGIDLKKAKIPLALSLVSVLGILIFGYMSIGVYDNYDVHASAKAEYEVLVQEKANIQKKRVATLKNNIALIDQLSKSPVTKSELAAKLSSLVAKNGLKISKLTSNDSGAAPGDKDTAIELEADGSYQSIKNFLSQARSIVLASDVIGLKITKSKEATSLHIFLAVKFTQPPKINTGGKDVEFRIGKNNYFFDSFDQWSMRRTGFVQAPDISDVDKNNSQQVSGVSSDIKRNDPFQAPPQLNPLNNIDGTVREDPANNQVLVKKNKAMYLSGIIHSENKKFCIVVLSSGESIVLAEGEKINGKYIVNRITDESVTFTGRKLNQIKVGQELSL